MFKNNADKEADFCEAYKSQILNDDTEETESPLTSILTILFLLVVIVALSIYGYNYFMSSEKSDTSMPPVSVQTIEDDGLKVIIPEKEVVANKGISKKESLPESTKAKSIDSDINNIADKVKIAISKTEEENESSKKSVKEEGTGSTYVEALVGVPKELEKNKSVIIDVPIENTESTYMKQLEKLTEEIDKERN